MSKLLVLAHEPLGGGALLNNLFAERGFDVHEHVVTADVDRPNDAAPFPDPKEFDVIVPMGSIRSLTNTSEISNWIFEELDLVRGAHHRGTPLLGVCFGGQMLAAALGGTVEQAPVAEIGWYEVRSPSNGSGRSHHGLDPGPWFQWHHDRFEPPDDAEVLAVSDNCVQLFRSRRSLGMQFHPEVTHAHLNGFLSDATDEYLHENGVDRTQMLAEMKQHEHRNAKQCEQLVDWFLDEVAGI